MFRHLILGSLATAFVAGAFTLAQAGFHRCKNCSEVSTPCASCNACDDCAPTTGCQEVEKTVMVPTIVTEMRKIAVTKYRDEERTRHYTVMKDVPEVKTREVCNTEMVPEIRTRQVVYLERKAVMVDEEEQYLAHTPQICTKTITWREKKPILTANEVAYTDYVPSTETRVGIRKVPRIVSVTKVRTVTEDQGHYETRAVLEERTSEIVDDDECCNQAGSCETLKRVWVPNIVTHDVEYTCNETVYDDEEYTYEVTVQRPVQRTKTVFDCRVEYKDRSRDVDYTVLKPETRTRTIQVASYVDVPKTREETYTVMTPQVKTATEEYTVMKQVPEQRTCVYTVKVPYTAEEEVPVRVCKMVPKTIKVRVPCAQPCSGCN